MKKKLAVLLAALCLLGIVWRIPGRVSVPDRVTEAAVAPNGSEAMAFRYTAEEKVSAIAEYLRGLTPRRTLKYPGAYGGMSYTITLVDDAGQEYSYIHFGNLFFRQGDGPWRELEYAQAEQLEQLLRQHAPDVPAEEPLQFLDHE